MKNFMDIINKATDEEDRKIWRLDLITELDIAKLST